MLRLREVNAESRLALQGAGMHPLMAKILAARGLADGNEVMGDISHLAPVSTMKGAQEMARILIDYIDNGKKITVVADYDCDGATACAVAVLGLRRFGAAVQFVVPDRGTMGYGLTPAIVEHAHAFTTPDVLLTVDNGIASHDGIARAAELGLQVLVTDHHLPGDRVPDARCIVNPNQPGCVFPSKCIAGVGVMFYVLMALRQEVIAQGRFTEMGAPRVGDLLDLVALGTVADVVRLDYNNRILVSYGLERMRKGVARPLIGQLFKVANRAIVRATTRDLAFAIGPRLNAAGRIADMSLGIKGLITEDEREAQRIAEQLHNLNVTRREMEAQMQEEAITMAEVEAADLYTLCLFEPSWHQGIVGLVASRMRERYYRPTIAFAQADSGELKGSGRSLPALHLRDAIDLVDKRNPGLIKRFGGHAAAAGLTVREGGLETFSEAFEQVVREVLDPSDLDAMIDCDGHALEEAPVTPEVVDQLDEVPWGQGFPPPQFAGSFDVIGQRAVGGGKHLQLRLSCAGQEVDAIFFGRTEPLPEQVALVYQLSVDEFRGDRKVKLLVQAMADGPDLELTLASNARRVAAAAAR